MYSGSLDGVLRAQHSTPITSGTNRSFPNSAHSAASVQSGASVDTTDELLLPAVRAVAELVGISSSESSQAGPLLKQLHHEVKALCRERNVLKKRFMPGASSGNASTR